MRLMSSNVRRLSFSIALALIITLLCDSLLALGIPSFTENCSASGCHDDPTGMTISANSTSIDVYVNEAFSLNVSVVGKVCLFPSSIANNSDFIYLNLNEEGMVEDGDPSDRDLGFERIRVLYNVTAPQNHGQYTLWLFSAKRKPSGNSTQLSLNVIEPSMLDDIVPLLALSGIVSAVVLGLLTVRSRLHD